MQKEWHKDPKLQGRFHPDYPDDLQVVVHNGGPRLSKNRPELVWVRIIGCKDNIYSGEVLNQPKQLEEINQASIIDFIIPETGEFPLQVRKKYLSERANWIVTPCNKCGLTELFDAPSDLIKVTFPDTPSDVILEMFTAFCGFCGGVQVVQYKDAL